eukprot:CAMPEP_0174339174 /NCGR_PEP_ID=MMETSP0810-20121108/23718_1 /TAXON_ID=73025 ORGANISM="Eutreptiella gymnastica-like, Strain CCMP1594" /NCGR_SAMPLE_ID=MMETSP0810 /ASSEMBLY_ACC=CAM_ASM_000659 /LENGTH=68 /DNA_ID=CAMNT_0015459687 /DNA_START=1096 /DNA_END=1302 /DNA_ORIENTATION=-
MHTFLWHAASFPTFCPSHRTANAGLQTKLAEPWDCPWNTASVGASSTSAGASSGDFSDKKNILRVHVK